MTSTRNRQSRRIKETLEQMINLIGELRDAGVGLDSMPKEMRDAKALLHIAHSNILHELGETITGNNITTPKGLATHHKHGCMPPLAVKLLDGRRNICVTRLAQRDVITVDDLAELDRIGRFRIASEFFAKCNAQAQYALLHDEHPHVQSAAQLA